MAMELVEHIEVGAGGAASIEFTSIPQDGVDLVLVASLRNDFASTGNGGPLLKMNGVTTDSFSWIRLLGTGSSVSSSSDAGDPGVYGAVVAANATANTFANIQYTISNYTSSAVKSISGEMVRENNATSATQALVAGSTSGSAGSVTAAITSIKLSLSNDFDQYSTASLYKIY